MTLWGFEFLEAAVFIKAKEGQVCSVSARGGGIPMVQLVDGTKGVKRDDHTKRTDNRKFFRKVLVQVIRGGTDNFARAREIVRWKGMGNNFDAVAHAIVMI